MDLTHLQRHKDQCPSSEHWAWNDLFFCEPCSLHLAIPDLAGLSIEGTQKT
jgi:hypothetical protein